LIVMDFFSPGFDFLSTSQEIGWKECLRYDLFSAKWDVETPSRMAEMST